MMQNSWHVCEQPAPNQRTAPVCGCMTNPGDQPHQDLDKTAMDSSLEFWEEKWERNHTPWHMREAHPLLVRYYDKLFPSDGPSRVLVPLCGKSLDLRYLWQRGHDVTGIDGVAAVVPAFVQESGVQLDPVPDQPQRHRTSDGRLTILIDDFFHVSHPSLDQTFTCVWDRASLYALSPGPRRRYVQTIRRLLSPDFRYLLAAIQYDDPSVTGPPYNIPLEEVQQLFGEFAEIEKLGEVQKSKFRDLEVKEVVYLLTARRS